ncbi:MAG TPA: hypothetical protein VLT59_08835, partial [Steroidobacteraceae bacterium]|nr:hypothetical protein [Steroidobacteraceae bacterium]
MTDTRNRAVSLLRRCAGVSLFAALVACSSGAPPDAINSAVQAGKRMDDGKRVAVRLVAGPTVTTGAPVQAAFGVPFPRGVVTSTTQMRVVASDGRELPSSFNELLRWRTLGDPQAPESVRAALVHVEVEFGETREQRVFVEYDRPRSRPVVRPRPSSELWTSIGSGPDPEEYGGQTDLGEPAVYAVLDAEWLGNAFLRSRMRPVGSDPAWRWFDEAQVAYARTMVNDVPDGVAAANRIDYVASAEPWQLDRASA